MQTESNSIPNITERFLQIRQQTEKLCEPLHVEDYVVQPVIDVSPPKWHLAHTSWFFETFMLKKMLAGYKEFHPRYNYIFNSYYDSVGERVARADRGNLTRPNVEEVMAYRKHVNENMQVLISSLKDDQLQQFNTFFEIGLQHEQQHQELLVTDIKYILGHNPLQPPYNNSVNVKKEPDTKHFPDIQYMQVPAGMYQIGYDGNAFAWDNESPKHEVYLHAFKIADRLVTNGEYLKFIEDGGYENFKYWLSDGWLLAQENNWQAPLYWQKNNEDKWQHYTLRGTEDINWNEPVTHISFYEADAYASWAGKRLLTEFEWEAASKTLSVEKEGNLLESNKLHPEVTSTAINNNMLRQMFGSAWEWTYSGYFPYPGYKRAEGPLGEYNGKFMINQMVLRGGSCATPQSHFRPTYRNFFQPGLRWQFTGIRLAE